ncbi:HepT-like ribonuclease domain-containing protein [Rhizobium panacihumi]|uniref:HepT-like ribonuclease domain-containing protein n=1 Tax=Rhizobium panacihumi TaxID=2008450 RepID=UPI003D797966
MSDRLQLYVKQMETSGVDACNFVEGMSRDAFLKNVLVQRAVGMSLLMLGEAVVRLAREYPEVLVDHPSIPWAEIQGLRHRIAHGYFDIDLSIVWETTQASLPDLIGQLQALRHWRAQGE